MELKLEGQCDNHHTTEITQEQMTSFYFMIAMSPVKEVPGSSPGWGNILFIFTLSPLGTKSQKCKKTEHSPKIGVSTCETGFCRDYQR